LSYTRFWVSEVKFAYGGYRPVPATEVTVGFAPDTFESRSDSSA
jgi:hypothetical protein